MKAKYIRESFKHLKGPSEQDLAKNLSINSSLPLSEITDFSIYAEIIEEGNAFAHGDGSNYASYTVYEDDERLIFGVDHGVVEDSDFFRVDKDGKTYQAKYDFETPWPDYDLPQLDWEMRSGEVHNLLEFIEEFAPEGD